VFARNVGLVNAVVMTHSRTPLRAGEIARAADLARQIVASALRTLEKRGLIKRKRSGDYDVFEPDSTSPYYPSAYLAALVDLPVASALRSLRPHAVYVYGSMATPGKARPGSDIDLLVVGDFDRSVVQAAVSRVGDRIGRRVDAFVLTPEQLDAGRRKDDAHVRAALDGVRLLGQA